MERRSPSRAAWLLSALLLGAGAVAHPQAPATRKAGNAATQALLEKARTLEARGRMEMASQTWQQVLLADPNNTAALGGLARAAKLAGDQILSDTYLKRLKAINPTDPGVALTESVLSRTQRLQQLDGAGKLAAAGNYAQAMLIYRRVFGSTPPPGEWALAYYETEAATDDGRPHAIAGLRSLAEKSPQDPRYEVALGRILTYTPRTRADGRRILERYPNDPQATEALRQSLLWDAAKPASTADVRAYLQKHKDPKLQEALQHAETQRAKTLHTPVVKAQTQPATAQARPATAKTQAATAQAKPATAQAQPATSHTEPAAPANAPAHADSALIPSLQDKAAYTALNRRQYREAESRFMELLAKNPLNARALAGMGYLRIIQQNFGAAISFLEQARQDGAKGLDGDLATARYGYLVQVGGAALARNDLTTAEKQYAQALSAHPSGQEALQGLGETLLKAQQPAAAEPYFAAVVTAKPDVPGAWWNLFLSQYQAGDAQRALETNGRMPPAVKAQLLREPDFLRSLASAYSAVGRDADAQHALQAALDLPVSLGTPGAAADTKLQYASLLLQANHMDQAVVLYRQVLAVDQASAHAWQGLVTTQHAMHNDVLALSTLQSMPSDVYEQSLLDPAFLGTAAAVYTAQDKLDIAQGLLERSVAMQQSTGQKVPAPLQVQLAALYLKRNDAARAYPVYQRVLSEYPDRVDAWKGLVAALHSLNRDREALAQIQGMPLATRHTLESDVDYLGAVGNIYTALGQPQAALVFIDRVEQIYAQAHTTPPAAVDIQNAYLLYNSTDEVGLYRQLLALGSRSDLTDDQRRTVQTIWANWAVRRANQTSAGGDTKRSLMILNAAASSFPDNPGVLRSLAGGYVTAGQPGKAVAIFKTQDMSTGPATLYTAAIGAAIAARDTKDAGTWLRSALGQYPKDSGVLALAAKYEQTRGDSRRAAEYYRASLAFLPPPDSGAELAYLLNQPGPLNPRGLPNGKTADAPNLATLLAPGNAGRTLAVTPLGQQQPYLPSAANVYGAPTSQFDAAAPLISTSSVPEYMSNPGPLPVAAETNLPQSEFQPYLPYQQEQVRRVIEAATLSGINGASTVPEPGGTNQPEGAQTADFNGEVYGPYIPYHPPTAKPSSALLSYTPSPVSVPATPPAARAAPARKAIATKVPAGAVPRSSGDSHGQQYPQPAQRPSIPAVTSTR